MRINWGYPQYLTLFYIKTLDYQVDSQAFVGFENPSVFSSNSFNYAGIRFIFLNKSKAEGAP
jgi:hypothetical protein